MTPRTPAEFYDLTANAYELMTGGDSRLEKAGLELADLVKGLNSKRVLDLGCGTGTDSIAFTQIGCEVKGIDSSSEMIRLAAERAAKLNLEIDFQVGNLKDLELVPDGWADLILCRGNTIPHLHGTDDLKQAIRSFTRVSKPGGILVMGWLNYIPVLRDRARHIATTGSSEQVLFRFNDITEQESIIFNLVTHTYDKESGKWQTKWERTPLNPWRADDLGILMAGRGWAELEIASNLARDEFDPDTSKDVFVFAVRE